MNVKTIFGIIVICFFCIDSAQCVFELLSVAGGVLSAIGGTICRFKECCTDQYIPGDLDLLDSSLKAELYDQHLAVKTVREALENHIHNVKPNKALALSFHGATGTGKNHMANLIVDALFKNGVNSSYVHHHNGYLDFNGKNNIEEYQNEIQEGMKKYLGWCPRSIFIFDKVDQMPAGVIDALLPFLDYNPRILSINPTRAIFIFISNTGAASIEKQLIEMWQAGTKREDTKLEDFESLLAIGAYNGEGGFHKSDIVKMNFVDHYVPFLPLEQSHVRKCIDAAFREKNSEQLDVLKLGPMIDEAMKHMTFGPVPHNLYSESGCKRVHSKVTAIIERSRFTNPSIP